MARLSKTTPFDIYEDQTTEAAAAAQSQYQQDGARHAKIGRDVLTGFTLAQEEDFVTESEDGSEGLPQDTEDDGDDERRDSYLTKSSVSSVLAESVEGHACQPYNPILSRTPQQRPHSSLGVPMSSPTPWPMGNTKGSITRSSRSRAGTPRAQARRSPLHRKQAHASMRETKAEQQPLVLLHVKLLPVSLPWSLELMREILPKRILDNLQLLRSKATDTVLQRGVLLPHPGEDYELLEERLLEALELQPPRITKCGHFRSRQSTSSAGSDSGIGSSVEGLDDEHCSACHHHISATKGKWWIRVFAANGLMRANTWAAAWTEMERVDAEIMPFISDRLRMTLDERKIEQQAENGGDIEPAVKKEESQGFRSACDEAACEDTAVFSPTLSRGDLAYTLQEEGTVRSEIETKPESRSGSPKEARPPLHESGYQDLPQVYRPKDIPLSILLRNYILLLARDRRKVAIFFLAVLGLFFALRPAAIPPPEPFVPAMLLHSEPEQLGLADMAVKADMPAGVDDAAPAHLVTVGMPGAGGQGVEQERITTQVEERGEDGWRMASDAQADSFDEIASTADRLGLESVLGGISVPYHIDAFGLAMCMALK